MPEEINRLVTDAISDLFFVTEPAAVEHLLREGKPESKVHYVGNVMIDNLFYQMDRLAHADTSAFPSAALKARLRKDGRYAVATLHRPSNVDDEAALRRSAQAIVAVAEQLPTVFPVHPRTRAKLDEYGIDLGERVHVSGPLPYMEFLNLWKDAALVVTDSGGLQEETTSLGIPCVTFRENTERPVTVDEGTNVIAGTEPRAVVKAVGSILDGRGKVGRRPSLWDGRASMRIVDILMSGAGRDL
jgi:UDP-N-acetylglucosamine 2-epimerase (non-hydrolysing)